MRKRFIFFTYLSNLFKKFVIIGCGGIFLFLFIGHNIALADIAPAPTLNTPYLNIVENGYTHQADFIVTWSTTISDDHIKDFHLVESTDPNFDPDGPWTAYSIVRDGQGNLPKQMQFYKKLTPGQLNTTYYYSVRITDKDDHYGLYSNDVSININLPNPTPPGIPQNLTITKNNQGKEADYLINWDDVAAGADVKLYELQECTDPATFTWLDDDGNGWPRPWPQTPAEWQGHTPAERWLIDPSGNGSQYQIYLKQPNGTYNYRVIAEDKNGFRSNWHEDLPAHPGIWKGTWSPLQSITVNCPSPTPPTVPVNLTITKNNLGREADYLVNWDDSQSGAGINVYELQESLNDPDFTNPVSLYIPTSQYQYYLKPNGTYYYKIKAEDVNGFKSEWSSVVSVTVNCPSPTPPTTPANLTVTKNNHGREADYLVDWDDSASGAGINVYELQESLNDSSFTNPVTIYPPVSQYQYYLKGNGTYYYRVKAEDINGFKSEGWSNIGSVTVNCLPPTPPTTPVLSDPVLFNIQSDGYVREGDYKLTWTSSDSGVGINVYELEEATDPGFTQNVQHYYPMEYDVPRLYHIFWQKSPNATYYYRVRAEDKNGFKGNWSNTTNPITIEVPPPPPAPANIWIEPNIPINYSGNFNLNWSKVTPPDVSVPLIGYEIWESENSETFEPHNSYYFFNGTHSDPQYKFKEHSDGAYYYKVRAEDRNGYKGNWTAIAGPNDIRAGQVRITSGPTVINRTQTGLTVEWDTNLPSNTKITYEGNCELFTQPKDVNQYVQGVIWAPVEDHGEDITTAEIDKDILFMKNNNMNAVNIYTLGQEALQKIDPISHLTLEEYIFAKCAENNLKFVLRFEWSNKGNKYLPNGDINPEFPYFDYGPEDADAIIAYYQETIEKALRYKEHILYYLINIPLDDTELVIPTIKEQREYVKYFRDKLKNEFDSSVKVFVNFHYGTMDELPQASVGDLVDGLSIAQYAVQFGASPYGFDYDINHNGVAEITEGPVFTDPNCKIIAKDQFDYFLDKLAKENEKYKYNLPIYIDQSGFGENLNHWSGKVAGPNKMAKQKAVRLLKEYLETNPNVNGFFYFKLYNKESEGNYGLIDNSYYEVDDPIYSGQAYKTHHVITLNLFTGAEYNLECQSGLDKKSTSASTLPFSSATNVPPNIKVSVPPYGITPDGGRYFDIKLAASDPDSPNAKVSLYYNINDRLADAGRFVGSNGTLIVANLGLSTKSYRWDISALPTGRYYIYAKVEDGVNPPEYDFSSGLVVPSAINMLAYNTDEAMTIDGNLSESEWQKAPFLTFATHTNPGSTTAKVKALWDNEYLYLGFDVNDQHVETGIADYWDSDYVAAVLSNGYYAGYPGDDGYKMRSINIEDVSGRGQGYDNGDIIWRAIALKPGTTLNNDSNIDAGYTVEMKIKLKDIRIFPSLGARIAVNFTSLNRDGAPGEGWDHASYFGRIAWDKNDLISTGRTLMLVDSLFDYVNVEAEDTADISAIVNYSDTSSWGSANISSATPAAVLGSFNFEAPREGNYKILIRVSQADDTKDSVKISINGEPAIICGNISGNHSNWKWVDYKSGDINSKAVFYLNRGKNNLRLINNEVNTKIDSIIITNNIDFVPSDNPPIVNGSGWENVVSDGFGDSANYATKLSDVKGSLFASTSNSGKRSVIYRADDGQSFIKVFDYPNNTYATYDLELLDLGASQNIYAVTLGTDSSGYITSISKINDDNSTVNANIVGGNNLLIKDIVAFKGNAYAGFYDRVNMYSVMKKSIDPMVNSNWINSSLPAFGIDPVTGTQYANLTDESSVVFKGYLYVGTYNMGYLGRRTTGAQIWRTQDGVNWEGVMLNGFGSINRYAISHMAVFGGYLYVSLNEYYTDGIKIYRTKDGINWQLAYEGMFNEAGVGDMISYMGRLYLATQGNYYYGGRVYSSLSGTSWSRVSESGISEDSSSYVVVGDMHAYKGSIYVNTINGAGTKIYRSKVVE